MGNFFLFYRTAAGFHSHNTWCASAQQLICKRTTAVVRFKVLTIQKTDIISSGNNSYIFRLLLLYFPAATPISFNHFSYIFQWLLILVTIVRSDDICDTSDTYDTCFLKLSSRGQAGKIFQKSFPPAYVREFFKKTLSPVSSVIPK